MRSPDSWLRVALPVLTGAVVIGPVTASAAQTSSQLPTITAVRTERPPRIDGRLDEGVWARAEAVTQFTQLEPAEGTLASERTEIRILYDDDAIYVGARMYDRGVVTRRLGRRDMGLGASDWIRVSLDSYRDRATAFRFDVNPSGVRRDATLTGEAAERESLAWDAVWEAATAIDGEGWTAEYRIPLSQVSFGSADEQTWGIQLERIIDRLQERAVFAFTPRTRAAGISAFGELVGLQGLRRGHSLEVMPYVLGRALLVDPGANPYRGEREAGMAAGADARFRVAPNLTLAATANPDFGQVEVDPAVINLTAFETFFSEKRPFFVEGASSFAFPAVSFGPGGGSAQVFYSRRIGRRPQLGAPTAAADVPEATSILAAAKLTGRTASGWSIGVLDALTQAEHSRYRTATGEDAEALVEPRANYLVARVRQDARNARRSLGAIVTAVNRDLADPRTTRALRSAAYTGGVDFRRESSSRGWALTGSLTGSHVRGSSDAITRTQLTSARYFARPDAGHLELDPAATSLSGYAAQLQVTKQAGRYVRGSADISAISPGYEVNDLGFQSRADRIGGTVAMTYTQQRPGHTLQRWDVNGAGFGGLNYGGEWISRGVFADVTVQHASFWSLILGASRNFETHDDRLTRGGPLARTPAHWAFGWVVASDPRKPVTLRYRTRLEGDARGSNGSQIELTGAVRPSPRWSFSGGPVYERNSLAVQYVTRVDDPFAVHTYGARHVFAPLEYRELSLETRVSVSLTPVLTFELFAQPLLSRGSYGRPREFATPGRLDLREYASAERTGTQWVVDPDGPEGAAPQFEFAARDFEEHTLRGNAVLRWEWRPGSTLFLVWQQARTHDDDGADFALRAGARALLRSPPDNVFVLKLSYWINPKL